MPVALKHTWAEVLAYAKEPNHQWYAYQGIGGKDEEGSASDRLLQYSDEPLTQPLFPAHNLGQIKAAIELHRKLQFIIGEKKSKKSCVAVLIEYFKLIRTNPLFLSKEAYYQVMKHMNGNPSINSRVWLWKVFNFLVNAVQIEASMIPAVVNFLLSERKANLDGTRISFNFCLQMV